MTRRQMLRGWLMSLGARLAGVLPVALGLIWGGWPDVVVADVRFRAYWRRGDPCLDADRIHHPEQYDLVGYKTTCPCGCRNQWAVSAWVARNPAARAVSRRVLRDLLRQWAGSPEALHILTSIPRTPDHEPT